MEKYNLSEGNESLKRILLMMKYDNKKTLSENVGVISEQNIQLDVFKMMKQLDAFNTDEDEVINIIKRYRTKESFKNFIDSYKNDVNKEFGEHLYRSLNPRQDKKEWEELKTYLKTIGIELGVNIISDPRKGKSSAVFKGLEKTPEVSAPEKEKTPTPSQPSQEPIIPQELSNSEGVKKFQDWLDQNKKGWATGYLDGVLNKQGRGYGRFGPRTQKAWNQYKTEYLTPTSTGGETQQQPKKDYSTFYDQKKKDLEQLYQPLSNNSNNNVTQTSQSQVTAEPTMDDVIGD